MRKVGVMLQKYIDKYPVPQESVLLCPLGEGGRSVEDFGGDHMGLRRSGGGISQFTANEGKGGGSFRAWVGGRGDQVNSIVTQPMFSKLFSPSPPSDKWWPVLLILRTWNVQNNKRKIGSKKKKTRQEK